MLTSTNRENRQSLQEFYLNHSANSKVAKKTKDLAELSFIDFCGYLGFNLTPDQIIISKLVETQKQTVVVSAHGIGKSAISAVYVLYTIICKKGLGIVTAPTARQVAKIIFSEINRNFQKLKRNKKFQRDYGVNLGKQYSIGHTFVRELEAKEQQQTKLTFWYEPTNSFDELEEENYEGLGYAFGFTSKHNDSNAFQGLHYAGFMLIIADEACGISFEISEAIEACATGIDNHVLLIGNPIARGNPFEKSAKEQGCFRVTCFSHPNVAPYYEERGRDNWVLVDPSCLEKSYRPLINGAVTPQWIETAREKYGTNSLFWWTRVLAKFPRLGHGMGSLIPVEFVETICDIESFELSPETASQLNYVPLLVGVDVGESNDPTVVAIAQQVTQGNRVVTLVRGIFELETFGDGMQPERNYEFVVSTISHFLNSSFLGEGSVFISTDNTGLGVSLTRDLLKSHNYNVNAVHFAASAQNSKTFLNIRAEMAWRVRECFLNGTLRFYASCLENKVDELKYEISGISYTQDASNEKIKIIPKTEITQILGRSPNIFDSVCLLVESVRFSQDT